MRLKKLGLFFVKLLISVLVIGYTLYNLDLQAVVKEFREANPAYLLAAFLLFLLSYFLGAVQWHLVLRISRIPLRFAQVIQYYYVGLFFNNFLLSAIGGDAFRVYDINRSTRQNDVKFSSALINVTFDRFLGFLTLIILSFSFGLVYVFHRGVNQLFVLILAYFVVFGLTLLFLLNKRFAKSLVDPFKRFIPDRIYELFQGFYYELNQFKDHKRLLSLIVLVSTLVQFLRILAAWVIGHSLGDGTSLFYYVLFIPIVVILITIPVSVGGIGPREQACVTLFGSVGMPSEVAFSMAFMTYLIGVLGSVPGGFVFVVRKKPAAESRPEDI